MVAVLIIISRGGSRIEACLRNQPNKSKHHWIGHYLQQLHKCNKTERFIYKGTVGVCTWMYEY